MTRCLITLATATIFSGCCSVPAHVPFECPERPLFENYSGELWSSIPQEARIKISNDDLAMKAYILQCESAAEVHNQ